MPATFSLRSQGITLGNPYSVRGTWRYVPLPGRAATAGFQPSFIAWSQALNQYLTGSAQSSEVWASSDLINWTNIVPGFSQSWRYAAYSPTLNIWVMVSNVIGDSRIASSPDGINWTSRSAIDSRNNYVEWIPVLGIFFVVTETTDFYTSPDGIVWTARTHGNTRTWRASAYSPTLGIVAMIAGGVVGLNTQRAMTTPNPTLGPWTIRTTPLLGGVAPNWNRLVWAPELGLFVASAIGDLTAGCFMTSPDGIVWTLRQVTQPTNAEDIAYSPSLRRFISGAGGGGPPGRFVKKSDNGIDWAYAKTARPPFATRSVFRNEVTGRFIASNNNTDPNSRFQTSRSGR